MKMIELKSVGGTAVHVAAHQVAEMEKRGFKAKPEKAGFKPKKFEKLEDKEDGKV